MMGKLTGARPTDLTCLFQHRPELFGRAYCAWLDALLRGESSWSVGERELLASCVGAFDGCEAVKQAHGAVAALDLGEELVQQVWADRDNAPVSERLRAALSFTARLTAAPDDILPREVDALRAVGLDDGAIDEVVQICAAVTMASRVALALGAEPAPAKQLARDAKLVHKRGYAD